MKNRLLEDFCSEIHDLSSNCFDFGLFSKNFLAPSVTFKFSRTKVITNALLQVNLPPNDIQSASTLDLMDLPPPYEEVVKMTMSTQV